METLDISSKHLKYSKHMLETYGDPCNITTLLQHVLPRDLLLKHPDEALEIYVGTPIHGIVEAKVNDG